jgi:hypothetical protein
MALVLSACGPRDSLDLKVTAETPLSVSMWRGRVGDKLTPEQWRDFDDALQQVRYDIMQQREATGSNGIDEAMRSKIDGRTIRFVLQLGLGAKLMRLEAEDDVLNEKLAYNRSLRTRPGDDDSAQHLGEVLRSLQRRSEAVKAELADTREKLKLLVDPKALAAPASAPPSSRKPQI